MAQSDCSCVMWWKVLNGMYKLQVGDNTEQFHDIHILTDKFQHAWYICTEQDEISSVWQNFSTFPICTNIFACKQCPWLDKAWAACTCAEYNQSILACTQNGQTLRNLKTDQSLGWSCMMWCTFSHNNCHHKETNSQVF